MQSREYLEHKRSLLRLNSLIIITWYTSAGNNRKNNYQKGRNITKRNSENNA